MLCNICKKAEATVFLTHIEGQKPQKLDLCEVCAKEKGVSDNPSFSFADLLLGLGASQEIASSAEGVDLRCPQCGYTQADFKKAGRFGCSECYHTFAEGLEGLLKSMHKGTRHTGKVPQAIRQSRDLSDQLKGLQRKLDKAIVDEDYEQAANLRDEIKVARDRLKELSATQP
jgi:protein arginine kinase activator